LDRIVKKRRWSRRGVAALCGVAVVAVGIIWNVVDARRGTRLRVPADRLQIATVQRGEFQEYVPMAGAVVPLVTHHIDAIQGGVVEEVYREEGSVVEAGDEILKLSNVNLLLDFMYREADLFNQTNNLRNTKIAMEQNRLRIRQELLDVDRAIARQQRLTKNLTQLARDELVARDDHEEAKEELAFLVERRRLLVTTQQQDSLFRAEQVRQLEESLTRMQSNLALLRGNLDDLVVRAPVSGQLTALLAEAGQVKASGDRLGQIDVLDGYKVRAAVDEHYIARVSRGLRATVDLSGVEHVLLVDKVYPRVVNGRFDIDLSFEGDQPQDLRRGRTVHLRLELGDAVPTLLLPHGAFFQTTAGRWVFLLDREGSTARRHDISVGRKNPRYCEVLAGLEAGDRVVVSSYDQFADVERLVIR
jgi:HlyD family secretion protein